MCQGWNFGCLFLWILLSCRGQQDRAGNAARMSPSKLGAFAPNLYLLIVLINTLASATCGYNHHGVVWPAYMGGGSCCCQSQAVKNS